MALPSLIISSKITMATLFATHSLQLQEKENRLFILLSRKIDCYSGLKCCLFVQLRSSNVGMAVRLIENGILSKSKKFYVFM